MRQSRGAVRHEELLAASGPTREPRPVGATAIGRVGSPQRSERRERKAEAHDERHANRVALAERFHTAPLQGRE